jgi:hypothetical protein
MASLKALCPDGFPKSFYQENWVDVKGEVCATISNFFISGSFDKSVNRTHIVLIPKIHCLTIGLCNVLYKIFSKVLANC